MAHAGPRLDLGIAIDTRAPVDLSLAADVPLAVDSGPTVDVPLAIDMPLAIDSSLTVDSGQAVEAGPIDTAGCTVLPARFDVDTVLPKGCYFAQKTPVIAAAVKLTLSPGVTIIFSADTALSISADQVLVAAGTAADPVVLTAVQPQRGFWKGVSFSGTLNTNRVLDHVIVGHGKHASLRELGYFYS